MNERNQNLDFRGRMMLLKVFVSLLCLVLGSTPAWSNEKYQRYMKERIWGSEMLVEESRERIEVLESKDSLDSVRTLHDEAKAETFGDEIRSTVESVSDAISGLPSESLLSTDNRTTVKILEQRVRQYMRSYAGTSWSLSQAIIRYGQAASRQSDLDGDSDGDSDDETGTGHICERLGDDPDYLVEAHCNAADGYVANANESLENLRAYKMEIDQLLDDLVTPTTEE